MSSLRSGSLALLCRVLACAVAGLVLLYPAPALTGDNRIVVLASSPTILYREFVSAFHKALSTDTTIRITDLYLDDGLPDVDAISPDTRLVVTIGTRAASFAGKKLPHLPVLNTLIPESSFGALAGRSPDCSRRSAIFIDQPVGRQVRLAELLYPDARTYGILLGPTSRQRLAEIAAIRLPGDIHILSRVLAQEPGKARETLPLLRQSDLLIAINDPLVLNRESAKWLLYEAYERHLPVIGFSLAYVHAGAAAAVFSEPGQMGKQAAEITRRWLDGGRHCLPPPRYSEYFRVAVNRSVNASLGGRDLDEDELVRQIRSTEDTQ